MRISIHTIRYCNTKMRKRLRQPKNFVSFLIVLSFLLLSVSVAIQCYFCRATYNLHNPYILPRESLVSEDIYKTLSTGAHKTGLAEQTSFISVHYMWCMENYFTFKHYLSIMGIMKIIQPDEIIFHYVRLPTKREHNSATWIEDLQREVTILTFEPKPDVQLCQQFYADRSFTDTHISGLFIAHNIVISNLSRGHVVDKLKYTCNNHDESTCNKHYRNPPTKQIKIKASQTSQKQNNHHRNTEVINCPTIAGFYRSRNLFSCVAIMNDINVDDILYGDAHFVKLARSILYGSENPVEPISSIDNLIPLNGHVIAERFSFLTFVSIYSAVKIGGFKSIFFHGKYMPKSQFWDKLQTLDAQIVFVAVDFEQFPTSTHSLLQYSFYLLLQYGGVVFRENVIWLKPLTIEIRKYDTVASLRNPTEISTGGQVNFNILMAKTGSKFLQGLIPLHQQLSCDVSKTETDFGLDAYHLYEQQPGTIFWFEDLMYTMNCDQNECFSEPDNPRKNDKLAVFLQFSPSKTQLNFNVQHLGKYRQLDSGINIILNGV